MSAFNLASSFLHCEMSWFNPHAGHEDRCGMAGFATIVLHSSYQCLRSTTYPDCRRCSFAGLIQSRCPRAGPAGPLRWGRCPAALAVPLPLSLRPTAGGRRRALSAPKWGVSPFYHVPRLSSLSIRRAEQEPLPPGWARRATALGPLPRRPLR